MSQAVAPSPSQERNTIDPAVLEDVRRGRLESLGTAEILTWAVENFHPHLALQASFGNPEGLVLLDRLHRIEPGIRVFTLDTGRLHQATYDLVDRVRDRYDVNVEVLLPDPDAVRDLVERHGMNPFYESLELRKLCCRIRKVEPSRRHLAGLDAYVTGLRREQGVTRSDTPKVELEEGGRSGTLVKINPLAEWTHDEVWQYVRAHQVPVNRLHQQGFPTVGCAPCTRAIAPGEDSRAGRWWWENPETKECGLHVDEEADGSGI